MPTMQTFQVYRIKSGKLQLVCITFIVCQEWIFLFPPRLQTGQPPSNCLHPKVTAVQVVKETPKGPKGQRDRRSNHISKHSLNRTVKSTPFLMKPALTAPKKCELDILMTFVNLVFSEKVRFAQKAELLCFSSHSCSRSVGKTFLGAERPKAK